MRGIIFDMDGVLCDSEPLIMQAAQRMLRERYGIAAAPEDFHPFVGMGEDRYLGGAAGRHGVALRLPEDKVETYRIYLEMIPGRLPPLPGVLETVRSARAAGLLLAVASAADRMKVDGNLAAIGLGASAFDAIVTGSDVERKKPHPDAFLLAASRLGLPPADCLVVEDALSGLQAAVAAGSRRLGLTTAFPADRLRDAGAEWTAPHLGAMPAELRALLGIG